MRYGKKMNAKRSIILPVAYIQAFYAVTVPVERTQSEDVRARALVLFECTLHGPALPLTRAKDTCRYEQLVSHFRLFYASMRWNRFAFFCLVPTVTL